MTQTQVKIDNVIYNASTQCFEALVAVDTGASTSKYPCAIEAPMSMSFEQAAKGLETQALRLHKSRKGMYSQMRTRVAEVRAGRPRFDPRAWLSQLGFNAMDKAA